jgi:hypothetical protein
MNTTLWWSRWLWILLATIIPRWTLSFYVILRSSPCLLRAYNLATIVGRGEQVDEVGPSLRCFCCWLCGSNQTLLGNFVLTFCGPWHYFQVWSVLFLQVFGEFLPWTFHHEEDTKLEYKYGTLSLRL